MSSTDEIVASETIAMVINLDIKPDRVEEFLVVAEKLAIGSRAEDGNLRFDVIKSQDEDKPNKYIFYELWKNGPSVGVHKGEAHFKLWKEFLESGGVETMNNSRCFGHFIGK